MEEPAKRQKQRPLKGATAVAGALTACCFVGWPFLRHALRRTAPYVPASESLIAKQLTWANSEFGARSFRLVDLGSGDGAVVLAFAQTFSAARCVGVENNPWLTLLARWRGRGQKNARFTTADLFRFDVGREDAVLVCLVPAMLPAVRDKLQRELRPGAVVLSARFPIPGWSAEAELPGGAVDGLWCYRKT